NRGFSEMQKLSSGVTDLKKVLTNVKNRGVWGEISLDNLLEGMLYKDQYVKSCNVGGKSKERVDFAIVLPGKGEDKVYLPIDVKFPTEDYQRLLEATENGDLQKCSECVKALEKTIKEQAKSISQKYINPPDTTDYAIMYLPTEGLYAEVLRISGLVEELQNKFRIIPSGPSNTAALLNSLQMGFRSMAIKKSSIEVFKIFMEFKKDFGLFVKNIQQVKEQLDRANNTLDDATKRTSIIQKKLNKVEGMNYLENSEE
ncbi:MAG: DNA recombination protein RmuC, partial [Bacillota bacterium]